MCSIHCVWAQDMVNITFTNTNINTITPSKLVQWNSINRYLLDGNNTPSTIPKLVFINCHHFPMSLLNWCNNNPNIGFSTPLKLSQAISIQQLDFGHNWFTEYMNSMFLFYKLHMHIRSTKLIVKFQKYKKSYVQWPITTRDEISSYATSLKRNMHRIRLPNLFIAPNHIITHRSIIKQ